MKVCKFEKIKDEDEMKQVINCIQKEHPYVAVVPILAQLQEWLQAISISWFHEEDEASHATVNAIEAYCCTLANHLITDSHLNQEIKNDFTGFKSQKLYSVWQKKTKCVTLRPIYQEINGKRENRLCMQ